MTTLDPSPRAEGLRAPARFRIEPILVLFTLSGASGLMFEVIWSRWLTLLLGATTWSVLSILISYMGGLGLGAFVLGGQIRRLGNPLKVYAGLEAAIGLYALAVPSLLLGVGRLNVLFADRLGDDPTLSLALRFGSSILILGIPTLLMGATLPALTGFLASHQLEAGRHAGLLYATNTAGAILGALVTGFVFIPNLGVWNSNALAAGIDLAIAVLAYLVAVRLGRDDRDGYEPPIASTLPGSSLALVVLTLSGFGGLAYEVLWTRGLLAALTDSTTYAFTMMLAVFLAAHALGSARGSKARPIGDQVEWLWAALARSQIGAGLAALMSLPLLITSRGWINTFMMVEDATFWGRKVPLQLLASTLVIGPSAYFLGRAFPMASRLYVGRGRPVAASTGWLYLGNAMGAVAGAVVAAVILIPRLGTQVAIQVLGLGQCMLGLGVLMARSNSRGKVKVFGFAAGIAAIGVGWNLWQPLAVVYASKEPGKLLDLIDAPGGTVTVHEVVGTDKVISVNGVNVAGTNRALRTTQKLQGHLPAFLHGNPKSALQIGFGSGGTCRALSLHDSIETIEIAELTPEVLSTASKWFPDINRAVLTDPRVKVTINDARSHVAVTGKTYDLILSDSIHPRFRGNASLYTRDYFELCSKRLNPGGLVSTWLPLYGMAPEDIRCILRSLQDVFPHVMVWYPNFEPNENTVVIASKEPIRVDAARFRTKLDDPKIGPDLSEVGYRTAAKLLDAFLMGDRGVETLAGDGPRNTDDRPLLEFDAPRTVRRNRSFLENLDAFRLAREPIAAYLDHSDPALEAELAKWSAGTSHKLEAQISELAFHWGDAAASYEACVRLNPDDQDARQRWRRMDLMLGRR